MLCQTLEELQPDRPKGLHTKSPKGPHNDRLHTRSPKGPNKDRPRGSKDRDQIALGVERDRDRRGGPAGAQVESPGGQDKREGEMRMEQGVLQAQGASKIGAQRLRNALRYILCPVSAPRGPSTLVPGLPCLFSFLLTSFRGECDLSSPRNPTTRGSGQQRWGTPIL